MDIVWLVGQDAWGGTCPSCGQVIDSLGRCGCKPMTDEEMEFAEYMAHCEDQYYAAMMAEASIEEDYEWIRGGC